MSPSRSRCPLPRPGAAGRRRAAPRSGGPGPAFPSRSCPALSGPGSPNGRGGAAQAPNKGWKARAGPPPPRVPGPAVPAPGSLSPAREPPRNRERHRGSRAASCPGTSLPGPGTAPGPPAPGTAAGPVPTPRTAAPRAPQRCAPGPAPTAASTAGRGPGAVPVWEELQPQLRLRCGAPRGSARPLLPALNPPRWARGRARTALGRGSVLQALPTALGVCPWAPKRWIWALGSRPGPASVCTPKAQNWSLCFTALGLAGLVPSATSAGLCP